MRQFKSEYAWYEGEVDGEVVRKIVQFKRRTQVEAELEAELKRLRTQGALERLLRIARQIP